MLNKILLAQIQGNTDKLSAMTPDCFEEPSHYKGWIYPLRYLLALRYQKTKQKILQSFRLNRIYPVAETDYAEALIQQLSGKISNNKQQAAAKKPLFAWSFRSALVYPLLLAGILFASYQINHWYQLKRIQNVLANHLPYYSDLLHRKLMLMHNSNSRQLDKLDAAIKTERQKILGELPDKDNIRGLMAKQMDKLEDPTASSKDIMLGFKEVNTLFDKEGLPFYLTPKSFSIACSSLIDAPVEQMMMIKKMEELMSGGNPELCRTTMMTVYRVGERRQLFYSATDSDSSSANNNSANNNPENKKVELPLFRVKRVDKVPAIDSALGLTFKERGIGSIILMDRIKNFGEESVLPALTFLGRSYIIPYWMQGYYEIEEAVTKGYKKDLYKIYPTKTERLKVKSAIKKIIKNKNRMLNAKMQQTLQRPNDNNDSDLFGSSFDAISVLLGKQKQKHKKKKIPKLTLDDESRDALKKLYKVLLPSIEYHEAYHQIDKKNWKQPAWVKDLFKDKLTESGIDHTLEELGAYLSQLANTESGHNIWLSKLLIFSLNPMTKGQAEYYASGIILNAMDDLDMGRAVKANYEASVDRKTEIYSRLINYSADEIRALAKHAYEILFERSVPVLSP